MSRVAMSRSFTIRYFDPARSAVIEENVTASTEQELTAALASTGRVLLETRADQASHHIGRRPDFDVTWWCQELRTLIGAGMTVVEALETLQAAAKDGRRLQVQSALLKSLRQGQSLSKAMRGSGAFPEVLVASVTASERTSTLTTALADYLRYEDVLRRLKRQVVSAALYPAVVVTLGLLIVLFLMLYVIPRFARMYTGYRGEVSLPTELLLATSRVLQAYWPLALGMLAVTLTAAAWSVRRGHLQHALTWGIRHVPPLDRQVGHYRLAQLYQSMVLMFRGGYTVDEALVVCETLALGESTTAGIARARADLAQGRSAALAFSSGGLTDVVSTRLLAAGERTGQFEVVLQTIADRHAELFSTFVERAIRIVEPLLLLLVALVVGAIVVMMYLPIFDIASSIR